MSRRFVPPPPEAVADVRAFAERQLSREEFEAYVNAPMTAEEGQGIDELLDWFTARYPTPAERLRQARHAYQCWAKGMPSST